MNRLWKRSWLIMGLSLFLLAGLAVIVVRYAIYAPQWAAYRSVAMAGSSTHSANAYTVSDRNSVQIMVEDSGRSYHNSVSVRRAMLHILGDEEQRIQRVIFGEYSDELVGYNRFSGAYHSSEAVGYMQLTVSAQVQAAAQDALGGRKGVVGVYNYKTGEILCMVSSPNFDPANAPDIDETADEYEAVYVNRFTGAAYIPGSTFKLVTAAAALEEIEGIEERTFHCEGSVVISGQSITCNSTHGDISFEEALCRSCNVAFAEIAVELGADTLTEYTRKLGITDSLSFDGYVTKKGSIDLDAAGYQSVAWAGIGQYTDLINPCQYMVLMGAIANGGSAAMPYLVEQVAFADDVKYEAKARHVERYLNQDTAETLADMMHYAVVNNYGEWYFSGLYAGAKSGTAEQGEGKANNALLSGFVQDENYPLAFIVIVEGGGSGSATCTPIIRQVLDACVVAMSG